VPAGSNPRPIVTAVGVRGTFERWDPTHVGMGATVAAMIDRLEHQLGLRRPDVELRRLAVEYPASPWRYPKSRSVGADNAVNLVSPQGRFVLIGLSQGADVVRRVLASDRLEERAAQRIAAVVLLGDPTRDPGRDAHHDGAHHDGRYDDRPGLLAKFATPVPSRFCDRVWSYCLDGDEIACNHRGWIGVVLSGTHTHYVRNSDGVLDLAARSAADLLVASMSGSKMQ
jgi:hypothetical protein